MTDNDAIDADDEPPSVDKSIAQTETTTEPSTTSTTKRRLWTKMRVPTFERFVSMRPDDARSTVNEMIADRNASGAGNPKRIRSQSPEKSELETDALWMSDEPLSWEVLAAQVVKGRREVDLRELSLQERALVDEAKRTEWSTMEETGSVLLLTGQISQDVQEEFSHRFVDSRFVLTKKTEDDSPMRFKARWCLLGHKDPDVMQAVLDNKTASPTITQLGRNLAMQLIASLGADLFLGDIKGAFLESADEKQENGPLFAHLPPGGIPGVPSDAVIMITGNVYGKNDAPAVWYQSFDQEARAAGFERSSFDKCLYYVRDEEGKLCGVLVVHVDDTASGGVGKHYESVIQQFRRRYPLRKWQQHKGEYNGAFYEQDPVTKTISMHQKVFAEEKLRPIRLSRSRLSNRSETATDAEISAFRGTYGGGNWLASQSRPDLSVMVSLGLQCMPRPTVAQLTEANTMVRRAKQFSDLTIKWKPIPFSDLTAVLHTDASWGNAQRHGTQAGYIICFTTKNLNTGAEVPWTPWIWRSYRLQRVVPSTLSGEAQSLACGLGMLEWAMLHISEALDGPVTLRGYEEALRCRAPTAVVDCKSLYDHATAPTSPGGTDDKRCAIDVLIIRESLGRLKCTLRWTPGDRMLADALTKNSADPADLLRSCIRRTCYQISDETSLLQHRAQEKDKRLDLGVTRAARSRASHGSIQGDQGNEGTGVCSTAELLFLKKTHGEDVLRNSRQRAILRDLEYLTPVSQCGARPENMARVYRGTSDGRREGYRGRREKFRGDSHRELRSQRRLAQRVMNMGSLLR